MRLMKNLPAILLSVLLLFDAVAAYRFVDQGWPRYVRFTSGDAVQLVRVPFTLGDGLILAALVALHVFLIYLLRRSRRLAQPQH
jgi:hypothetical protein